MATLGWDVFLQGSYGDTTLYGRMTMLDSMREVLAAGFKKAGWEWQVEEGASPTGDVPPHGNQWSSNETEAWKVQEAKTWLRAMKTHLSAYNTTNVIASLQTGVGYAAQAWSGDAVLANNPDGVTSFPVGYIVPKQGANWWIDAMALHSKARNLWVAHQFMNYIHDPVVMRNLAIWNKYSCANVEARALIPVSENGYDLAHDPRLYPDETTRRRLDLIRDVPMEVMEDLYAPAWSQLKS